MNKNVEMKLIGLNESEKVAIHGGNPILVGLGLITSVIGLGKAADAAADWFIDGWKHPK